MSAGLTPVQANCLAFIARYQAEHGGTSPAYTDIMEELGLASKSGVNRLVTGLERRGRLRRIPQATRCLEVIGSATTLDLESLGADAFNLLVMSVRSEVERRRLGTFAPARRAAS